MQMSLSHVMLTHVTVDYARWGTDSKTQPFRRFFLRLWTSFYGLSRIVKKIVFFNILKINSKIIGV